MATSKSLHYRACLRANFGIILTRSYSCDEFFQKNLADAPSRVIAHDELSVTHAFMRLVEFDLKILFSYDTCRLK